MVPTQTCGAGETFGGQQESASCNGKRSIVLKSWCWLKQGGGLWEEPMGVLQQHLMHPRQQRIAIDDHTEHLRGQIARLIVEVDELKPETR
jgi:hypothetical protein